MFSSFSMLGTLGEKQTEKKSKIIYFGYISVP